MGNKTAYKEERQTEKKKNEQERKIKIDKKKGVQILACAH